MGRKNRVAYFYDSDFGSAYYGANHPMKPHRLVMAHHLIVGYGLHKYMDVIRPRMAYRCELELFHSPEYVDFLSAVVPETESDYQNVMHKYGFGDDCPVFADMYDFCRLYTGASMDGARRLNTGQYDVAINWSGGLHHAKKGEASGV